MRVSACDATHWSRASVLHTRFDACAYRARDTELRLTHAATEPGIQNSDRRMRLQSQIYRIQIAACADIATETEELI